MRFFLFVILSFFAVSDAYACGCVVSEEAKEKIYASVPYVAVIAVIDESKDKNDEQFFKVRTLKNIKGELPEIFEVKGSAVGTSCRRNLKGYGQIKTEAIVLNKNEYVLLDKCSYANIHKKIYFDELRMGYDNNSFYVPEYKKISLNNIELFIKEADEKSRNIVFALSIAFLGFSTAVVWKLIKKLKTKQGK